MIGSELDAAGVHDPALRDAYRRCRLINARHGRTFFLATRLLAPEQRPAVHALYGFARQADDILDDFDPVIPISERADNLQRLATRLFNRMTKGTAGSPNRTGTGPPIRTTRRSTPWCTPRAATASRGSCSTTSWRRCGWT